MNDIARCAGHNFIDAMRSAIWIFPRTIYQIVETSRIQTMNSMLVRPGDDGPTARIFVADGDDAQAIDDHLKSPRYPTTQNAIVCIRGRTWQLD